MFGILYLVVLGLYSINLHQDHFNFGNILLDLQNCFPFMLSNLLGLPESSALLSAISVGIAHLRGYQLIKQFSLQGRVFVSFSQLCFLGSNGVDQTI